MSSTNRKYEVVVIGGAGHIGAPLSILLAAQGVPTLICDINEESLEILKGGKLPFLENQGEELLLKALSMDTLGFTNDHTKIQGIPYVILTIGTPIDEFHNPVFSLLTNCVDKIIPYLNKDQVLILRSTVAPGTTHFLEQYLRKRDCEALLSFCPERVVQGKAIEEIRQLPQLVSGTSTEAFEKAKNLFLELAPEVVEATPAEAEFAKLICNAYRYIEFAATNQMYMLVESAGVDYIKLLDKMKKGYPRMASIPGPGFAAGPCLMKDTMQLGSFSKKDFVLGQVATLINEGLPDFIVSQLGGSQKLKGKKVGILGMAFKAQSDDIRDSLSFKLGKTLLFHGAEVLCCDPYARHSSFTSESEVLEKCGILIIGVPHVRYAELTFPAKTKVVDLWGITRR
ncbi:MAG: nucleotide sugar dehydrogenase [Bacteroidota bacterium]